MDQFGKIRDFATVGDGLVERLQSLFAYEYRWRYTGIALQKSVLMRRGGRVLSFNFIQQSVVSIITTPSTSCAVLYFFTLKTGGADSPLFPPLRVALSLVTCSKNTTTQTLHGCSIVLVWCHAGISGIYARYPSLCICRTGVAGCLLFEFIGRHLFIPQSVGCRVYLLQSYGMSPHVIPSTEVVVPGNSRYLYTSKLVRVEISVRTFLY